MLLHCPILAPVEGLFHFDLGWLCWRMLWVHRSLISSPESVEWCSPTNPTCTAHGLTVISGRSTVHDTENAGTILRSGAYETTCTILDVAFRYGGSGGLLPTVWWWYRGIHGRHEPQPFDRWQHDHDLWRFISGRHHGTCGNSYRRLCLTNC